MICKKNKKRRLQNKHLNIKHSKTLEPVDLISLIKLYLLSIFSRLNVKPSENSALDKFSNSIKSPRDLGIITECDVITTLNAMAIMLKAIRNIRGSSKPNPVDIITLFIISHNIMRDMKDPFFINNEDYVYQELCCMNIKVSREYIFERTRYIILLLNFEMDLKEEEYSDLIKNIFTMASDVQS